MNCPACGAHNDAAARFCQECGTSLALSCPQCGAQVPPRARFCNQCGAAQSPAAGPPPRPAAPAGGQVNEQRLVSILFMDLVGFTPLSENRDPGEVRELLSRYFEVARQLVERYNGTVQKFIGDAVVAVWGTPTAREDDAERAVRTGLELVTAVAELGSEVGMPDLAARVGVHSGPAAVTVGAEAEGMVVGDMVNTASRIQGVAPAGGVLVAESTRQASEAAIAYEDAGTHELKGKSEPLRLWRAVRVTATRGGALKSAALEPPFVGREREFRMTKDLFHATVDDRRAHHLAVLGMAGIGKSRLAWEFEKYIDGVALQVLWHHGRCLAYGSGVAYSALAEMIRARARIVEAEEPAATRTKLREAVELYVADPEERAWIEPRLAHLLGLEEREGWEREELFSGWRLFIERMAAASPVVMVFEDMHWADAGLLDFVDSMLERSRDLPLFVVTLSRPDAERGDVGRGRRSATSLYLEPLPPAVMGSLLDGLVPGLPEELRGAILERAEGVPLYAVEMVRMLLAQGVLAAEGGEIHVIRNVGALKVPDTLHSLVAARLDELTAEERRLLQVASVLGKTFRKDSLPVLIDYSPERIDELLAALLRSEVLSLQADPRSPDRGQYGFIQDLIRHVAYETLPRRERRALHLAVARHLEEIWGGEELDIVEVLAHHYLEAHRLVPDAEDAEQVRELAYAALIRAAERASSLAATEEAQALYEQAASVAADDGGRAALLELAGQMAWTAGDSKSAVRLFEAAIATFESSGSPRNAARVAAWLGDVEWRTGHLEPAVQRIAGSFEVLAGGEPDDAMATIAATLGKLYFFQGELDRSAETIELALKIAEDLGLPSILSDALNTKSLVLDSRGHPQEALALINHSLQVALANEMHSAALRAYNNLCNILLNHDLADQTLEHARRGAALAHKLGMSLWERAMRGQQGYSLFLLGRWDEALALAESVSELDVNQQDLDAIEARALISLARRRPGEPVPAVPVMDALKDRADVQEHGMYLMLRAAVLQAEGRTAEAYAAAVEATAATRILGIQHQDHRWSYTIACESAAALGDQDKLLGLLAALKQYPPGHLSASSRAQIARFQARLAAMTGADGAAAGFRAAENGFREVGFKYWLALTLREHAAWLVAQDKAAEAEPLLQEAAEIFRALGIGGAQPSSDVSSATTAAAGLTSVTASTETPA